MKTRIITGKKKVKRIRYAPRKAIDCIAVRITASQRKLIDNVAGLKGLSLSAFLRMSAINEAERILLKRKQEGKII